MTHRYYLSEHPRYLFRVETETYRVEVWSVEGWQPTIITVMQLDGLGGDIYQRVNPKDVDALTALWSE